MFYYNILPIYTYFIQSYVLRDILLYDDKKKYIINIMKVCKLYYNSIH